jgi:membrane protein implicated in regulation of membrane protease activity
MNIEWWHWLVAGLALVLLELVVPGMVLIWFGVAAVAIGLLVAVVPTLSLTLLLGLWTVLSCVLVFAWFRVFRRDQHKTYAGMSDGAQIGEVGLLVGEVTPYCRGKVRFQKPLLGSDVWDCIADDAIAVGERVKVLSVEGSLLKVGLINKGVSA